MKKKILLALLFAMAFVMIFATAAFASEESTEATEGLTGSYPNQIDWEYNPDTKTLYITPNANNENSNKGNGFTINGTQISDPTAEKYNYFWAWRANYATYADAVEHIHVSDDFSYYHSYQHSSSIFANWPNLKTIYLGKLTTSSGNWQTGDYWTGHGNFKATSGSGAFANNPKLTTVYGYGQDPETGTINLSQLNFSVNGGVSSAYNTKYLLYGASSAQKVILPTTVDNKLWDNMFNGCTSLTTVEIPSWVTAIDANAFSGCTALTSIEIPASVTSIGASAFADCSALKSVTLAGMDETALTIDSTAFTGCTANFNVIGNEMKELLISLGVAEENITAVTVISTGEQIDTKDATKISFSWELDYKGVLTFKTGSGKTVDVGNAESKITAFNEWRTQTTEGQSVPNEDLVQHIVVEDDFIYAWFSKAKPAFSGYKNLISINLGQLYRFGNSWTGYGIFQDNPKLERITNSNDSANNADGVANFELIVRYEDSRSKEGLFKNTPLITKIVFCDTTTRPESDTNTRKFADNAFSGLSTLKSVNIPSFTNYIGSKAFYGTGITEITIPASVATIGASAFATSALESITFEGTVPSAITIDSTAFDDVASLKAVVYSDEMKAHLVSLGFTDENVSVNCGGSFGDFTWEISGDVLTIDGSGTALAFGSTITSETLANIPWASFSAQITKVVLEAQVTALCDFAFAGLTNCTEIVIPESLTDFSASSVFSGDTKLSSVTVSGKDAVAGVIDLFNVEAVSADLFDGAAISAKVYLPKLSDTSFLSAWAEDLTSLTIVTYPTCDLATAVRANNAVALGYLPESYDPMLRRVGTVISTANGKDTFKYTFDEDTATLILTPPDSTPGKGTLSMGDEQDQTVEKIPQADGSTKTVRTPLADGYAAWKTVWCDAVLHVYVGGFNSNQIYVQNNDSPFSNLTKCVDIHLDYDTVRFTSAWPRTGLFQNCSSLTTISIGSEHTVDGVIDLSNWTSQDRTITNMFYNCSSITKIILPDELTHGTPSKQDGVAGFEFGFGANMFYGCTALEELSVPACFGLVGKDCFRGCTSLEKVTFESGSLNVNAVTSTTFPKTTTIDVFSTAVAEKLTGLGLGARDLSGVLISDGEDNGFQIRLEDYNGLRALFSFDEKKNAELLSYGYDLVEYGVIMTPATEYEYWGGEIDIKRIKGEYVTESSTIKKIPVYENGDISGMILSTTIPGTRVDFAGSVVKYNSNFKTDVYIGAYAIYTDDSGNYYMVNEVYEDSNGNKFFNIYDIALGMFINNDVTNILSKKMDEKAVWNVLLQGADVDEFYEKAVGSYEGITLTLVKEASDSTTYIPFIRSENGTAITDDIIAEAIGMLSSSSYTLGEPIAITIADQKTIPAVDTPKPALNPLVTTPNRYNTEDDKAQHCQSMCTDGTHIYYSFTGKIVKVRISDGVEVGTFTVNDDINQYSAHIGNIIYHNGKIYGSLGFWKINKKYIISIKADDIVDDIYSTDYMKATHFAEDNAITLFEGTENETTDTFGGGEAMLDSITVGKVPGGGFILPDGSEIEDNNNYLVFGAGSAYQHPTKRHDDDYLRLRFVDIAEVDNNAAPLDSARIESEEEYVSPKFVSYSYAGSTCVQVISYDKDTGDYHFVAYGRDVGLDDTYPNYDYFVVDGSKKLRLEELYLGQNTPEGSEIYEISRERAAQYKDKDDLDGDGDTDEPMLGFVADLVCVCRKHDINAHEAIDYDNSGYAGKICGMHHPAMADQGLISMGSDYFYAAYYNNEVIDDVTYFGQDARLYRLHRYNGAWSFVLQS